MFLEMHRGNVSNPVEKSVLLSCYFHQTVVKPRCVAWSVDDKDSFLGYYGCSETTEVVKWW